MAAAGASDADGGWSWWAQPASWSSWPGVTVRVVSPAPASKALEADTVPRALLAAGSRVWIAGANPGRVLAVSAG